MTQIDIARLLRADFDHEVAAGFPTLRRLPHTGIVQLIDYHASLSAPEQSALLDALASRAAFLLDADRNGAAPTPPAWERYRVATAGPGPFCGGYRYLDIKFLAAIPRYPEFGGYEGWIAHHQHPSVTERALQLRTDLLPDLSHLVPALAPALRKLVKATLVAHGCKPVPAKGIQAYAHPSGARVSVDFGSRMGQVCWDVDADFGAVQFRHLSYETLWGQATGWNYLSDENAERSIAILPGLLDYLAALPGRIAAAGN